MREEQGESKPRDEQEDNRQEPEPLNVSEGEEKEEVPANEEENQDWKDDKEKFWKQHCAGYEQDCERDAEDTEGLTLNISKDDKKLGQVRYSDQKHASIAGADGKTADYSVFLGLVKDAKRNNQAINFSGEMSPEFAAKLKLACEELGVTYQNAPEGKIDANGFEDQLSEESKRKLAEYNARFDRQEENAQEQPAGPKNYDEHLDQFKKDLADGKEIDLSAIADEKEKVIAYAAAMVAAKDAQKEDVAIKGAPEKTIGYKNEKVFEQDENGVIKRGEDGKPLMTEIRSTPRPKICRKKPGLHWRDTIRAFASSSWRRLAAGLPARRNARKKPRAGQSSVTTIISMTKTAISIPEPTVKRGRP